jgi:hypothetical protein
LIQPDTHPSFAVLGSVPSCLLCHFLLSHLSLALLTQCCTHTHTHTHTHTPRSACLLLLGASLPDNSPRMSHNPQTRSSAPPMSPVTLGKCLSWAKLLTMPVLRLSQGWSARTCVAESNHGICWLWSRKHLQCVK